MKTQKKITWKSPLMQISSVDIRQSKETEKDYAVVKVYAKEPGNPRIIRTIFRKGKKTTFLCFRGSLLPLLETDNWHIFEGEISFDWGSTYLCITKLYDNCGKRLLRPPKTIDEKKFCEKALGCISEDNGKNTAGGTEEEIDKNLECPYWPCEKTECQLWTEACLPF